MKKDRRKDFKQGNGRDEGSKARKRTSRRMGDDEREENKDEQKVMKKGKRGEQEREG